MSYHWTIPECARLDSNEHLTRFELVSSADWDTRAQPLPRLRALGAAVEASVGAIGTRSRRRL